MSVTFAQGAFDIDALIHEVDVAASPAWTGAPLRFTTTVTSMEALDEAWGRYIFENGHFACVPNSHMWHRQFSDKPVPLRGHNMWIYGADVRCNHYSGCSCVGDYLHRALCACGWASTIAHDESDAIAEWHDHALPGWRLLPIFTSKSPDTQPSDWQFDGAPIITARGGIATRCVPGASPFGGYDLSDSILNTTPTT